MPLLLLLLSLLLLLLLLLLLHACASFACCLGATALQLERAWVRVCVRACVRVYISFLLALESMLASLSQLQLICCNQGLPGCLLFFTLPLGPDCSCLLHADKVGCLLLLLQASRPRRGSRSRGDSLTAHRCSK